MEKPEVVNEPLWVKMEGLAHQMVEAMREKVGEASLKDLGAILAQVIDRMRLLREEAMTRIEATNGRKEMLERLIQRTMKELPAMTRQDVIEAIGDVRPDALKLLS